MKKETFQYFLWCIDYIFSFSFWHGGRVELTFQYWFVGKNGVLNAAAVWGRAKVPLEAAGAGQNYAGGPGQFGVNFQKAIDWLIIYSFFTFQCCLKYFSITLSLWNVRDSWFFSLMKNIYSWNLKFDLWIPNHKSLTQTLGDVFLVWVKYMVKYINISIIFSMHDKLIW